MNGELIAIPVVFGTVGVVLVTLTRSLLDHIQRTKSERLQADIYNKMIDKFGSSQDLLSYLSTEAGQNVLKSVPVERPAAYSRVLNSVQFGIISSVLGTGILVLRTAITDREGQDALLVIGSIILTIGIGLLLAAGASYMLSKSFGLFNGRPEAH